MKIKLIIPTLFSLIILFTACGGEAETKKKVEEVKKEEVNEKKTELLKADEFVEIEGIFTKGGHDDSYVMFIELEESGEYSAKFAYLEGMLPPKDMFNVIEFKPMANFTADLRNNSFTSDDGNGTFSGEFENLKVTFSNKKDFMGDALVLSASTEY